jgi:hypothetical protein
MKKALTTLVIAAALLVGSVSFAGIGPKTGGRTSTDTCSYMNLSALECATFLGQ